MHAIVSVLVLGVIIFQAFRWKNEYKMKTFATYIAAQVFIPILASARIFSESGRLELAIIYTICLNVSWLLASLFDPLGPFMDNPRKEFDPWAPDHYWKLESRRRPTVIFWPALVVLFMISALFVPSMLGLDSLGYYVEL